LPGTNTTTRTRSTALPMPGASALGSSVCVRLARSLSLSRSVSLSGTGAYARAGARPMKLREKPTFVPLARALARSRSDFLPPYFCATTRQPDPAQPHSAQPYSAYAPRHTEGLLDPASRARSARRTGTRIRSRLPPSHRYECALPCRRRSRKSCRRQCGRSWRSSRSRRAPAGSARP